MRRIVTFSVVIVAVFLNIAIAKESPVNLIPAQYNLTFDEAMRLVSDDHLLIKCLDVNSQYNSQGVGYGVSGQGRWDSWIGTRSFRVFIPYGQPAIARPSKCLFKWHSAITNESDTGASFQTDSKQGLNHIHVSLYRDNRLEKVGNYYLQTLPHVTTKQYEVVKPAGKAKRLLDTFAQGTTADFLFQIADGRTVSSKNGVRVGGELASVESSSEVAHAQTTTHAIRIGVSDDGQSIMFPAKQSVIVLTITEKLVVDKNGQAVKRVSLDKKEEMMLTIKKIRPSKGGEFKWRKR